MFGNIVKKVSLMTAPSLMVMPRAFSMLAKPLTTTVTVSRFSSVTPINNTMSNLISAQIRSFHIKKKTNRRKVTKEYKLKTHRASAKRFWVTGSGKIMHMSRGKRHRMRNKSSRQLRRLSQKTEVPKPLRKRYRISMPYLF